MVNLTITTPEADGYATIWPCDQPQPNASTINYRAGSTIANMATITTPEADGTICVYTSSTTHVIVDLEGALRP